mgnify:CR=1 FL=1
MSAVLYAFNNNLPIFFAECRRPFRFDYLAHELDLSCLKIPLEVKNLTTFEGNKIVGSPKEILWERLLFLLSLDGKLPLSNLCSNIRYDGQRVVCSNEYSKIMEFAFKECIYFGDAKSSGFVVQKQLDDEKYLCYDYIAFNKGGKHELDYIKTEDDLVSEIWFYPSDRIDGATAVKDAIAVSTLTHEQLHDFDFSETMARFKVVSEMETRGMKGLFNGYGTSGKPKHYKFRTTGAGRETNKRRNANKSQTENVKVPKENEGALLKNLPQSSVAYDRFLKNL